MEKQQAIVCTDEDARARSGDKLVEAFLYDLVKSGSGESGLMFDGTHEVL